MGFRYRLATLLILWLKGMFLFVCIGVALTVLAVVLYFAPKWLFSVNHVFGYVYVFVFELPFVGLMIARD